MMTTHDLRRMMLPLACLLAVSLSAGCPSDAPTPPPSDVSPSDTSTQPDRVSEDAGPSEQTGCCDVTGVCAIGEVCLAGVCHPGPNSGCYSDAGCGPGQTCQDANICTTCGPESTCEPVVGSCKYGAGCCNADAECDGGEICVEGTCRAAPSTDGQCWSNSHCGDGLVCEGIGSCPCGVADCTATAGYCAIPGVCCGSDAECGDGRCVAGSCRAAPEQGQCYSDEDCGAGTVCGGPALCECGFDESCKVPTTPGTCLAPADVVCNSHDDCADGWVCLGGVACAPQPAENQCYYDQHCGLSATCDGAVICPEGTSCDTPTTKGVCLTVPKTCLSEADCGPGLRCAIADITYCPGEGDPVEGVCVAQIDKGCWNNEDCPNDRRCAAEEICVDAAGCASPNLPGFCETFPKDGDCCVSHRDCAPGFQCRNNNTTETCPPNPTSVCVPEPTIGEECYNYFDCPAGLVCNNAFICACNARCGRSRMGDCALPSEQYCNADTDCGTDSTCARDWECLFNPCYNTNNCALGGKCQKDKVGQCWSHYECPSGEYCKGLAICPSNTTCPQNDEPGTCAPKEPAGACCKSYFACSGGTRCVSAATASECKLDVSSICVPLTQFNVTCFTDEDCAESRFCQGQKVCACGEEGCEPTAGNCILKGIGD